MKLGKCQKTVLGRRKVTDSGLKVDLSAMSTTLAMTTGDMLDSQSSCKTYTYSCFDNEGAPGESDKDRGRFKICQRGQN